MSFINVVRQNYRSVKTVKGSPQGDALGQG
jgi:hypothetical protein